MRQEAQKFLDNGDLILTLVLAVLIAGLRFLNHLTDQLVMASILGLLALLAWNILRNRQLERDTKVLLANIAQDLKFRVDEQQKAEEYFESYIDQHRDQIKRVVVIQCSLSFELLRKLIETKAVVTIFVHDGEATEKMGSKLQRRFIEDSLKYLLVDLSPLEQHQKLKIYCYSTCPTMNAIMINDEIIYLSWYIYEYPQEKDKWMLKNFGCPDDSVLVIGDNKVAMVGIVVEKGHKNFEKLSQTLRAVEKNYQSHTKPLNNKTLTLLLEGKGSGTTRPNQKGKLGGMLQLDQSLKICLLSVAHRYSDCLIEINPAVLDPAGLWKGTCTAEEALQQLQSSVPQLLQALARFLVDDWQPQSAIYLLDRSEEVPAFQLYCGKDHCGRPGRHTLHEPDW